MDLELEHLKWTIFAIPPANAWSCTAGGFWWNHGRLCFKTASDVKWLHPSPASTNILLLIFALTSNYKKRCEYIIRADRFEMKVSFAHRNVAGVHFHQREPCAGCHKHFSRSHLSRNEYISTSFWNEIINYPSVQKSLERFVQFSWTFYILPLS